MFPWGSSKVIEIKMFIAEVVPVFLFGVINFYLDVKNIIQTIAYDFFCVLVDKEMEIKL